MRLLSSLKKFFVSQAAASEHERTERVMSMLRIIAGGMIPHGLSALIAIADEVTE